MITNIPKQEASEKTKTKTINKPPFLIPSIHNDTDVITQDATDDATDDATHDHLENATNDVLDDTTSNYYFSL